MIKRKKASEIFGAVDPHLTVIDGGTGRRHRSAPLTKMDWDSAKGVICQGCGRETFQIINGLCPQCSREITQQEEEQREERAMRNYYRMKLREGTLDLHRMRQGLL